MFDLIKPPAFKLVSVIVPEALIEVTLLRLPLLITSPFIVLPAVAPVIAPDNPRVVTPLRVLVLRLRPPEIFPRK